MFRAKLAANEVQIRHFSGRNNHQTRDWGRQGEESRPEEPVAGPKIDNRPIIINEMLLELVLTQVGKLPPLGANSDWSLNLS